MKPGEMLDQLQNVLEQTERACREEKIDGRGRMPTMKLMLILTRVVYFLLERWVKEHD